MKNIKLLAAALLIFLLTSCSANVQQTDSFYSEPAISSEPADAPKILIDGPKETKAFIRDYFDIHPEIRQEAEKYTGVLDEVKFFQQRHPDAADGTYSALTGERVELDGGYSVTFHQNYTLDDPYGAYDADDYAAMCAIAKHELNSEDVYIGFFGNAEVSFICYDKKTAMDFAVENNQYSVYDCENDTLILNEHWNKNTNPVEGAGAA